MSDLRAAAEEYLAVRRSLGYKLGKAARVLHHFVAFAEREKATHVTTPLVLRWIGQPSKAQAATWAQRLSILRVFARWQSASDSRTEVPPQALQPLRAHCWRRPHSYDEADIPRLLAEAARIPSRKGLRGQTFVAFFGLIAVAGLRISEALGLDREHVDFETGVLTIRRSKFGKERLVPVHPTTCAALQAYACERDRIVHRASTTAFFVSEAGRRLTEWAARYAFARISQRIGLRPQVARYGYGRGPRIHDLRHRFAIRTLVDWYRAGKNVDQEITKLAAYLGHSSVAGTYWYIEAVPELLLLATERRQLAPGGLARD